MLFLKQIQEVGGGADAEKPLDGVEYDVDSALRSHGDQAILGHPRVPARGLCDREFW